MARILTDQDLRKLIETPEDRIRITVSGDSAFFTLRGKGSVTVFGDKDHQTLELSEDSDTAVTAYGTVCIDGASGITELDVHGQGVTGITFGTGCGLRKLVIYGNALTSLDCSNCKQLQFLHMQDNPLCDDDACADALTACMRSLPDRANAATGSILLYPWYGLEVLICTDDEGNYIKYPAGHAELAFEENRLYGVVEDGSITYYTYTGGALQAHAAMNRHHALRKSLESDICLRKNWIFGSAIMYDEHDWAKCPWDFRESHIADLWETAEKGFGLTYGGFDKFTNTQPGFKHFNVKDFLGIEVVGDADVLVPAIDYTDEANADVYSYRNFLAGNWQHGDRQLSFLFGNGEESDGEVQRFGIIPNACCYLIDKAYINDDTAAIYTVTLPVVVQALVDNSDTISFSFVHPVGYVDDAYYTELRQMLGVFSASNIFTQGCNNGGDGIPYTCEDTGVIAPIASKYSVINEDGSTTEMPSPAIVVSGLTPDRSVHGLTDSGADADLSDLTRADYLTCYASAIRSFDNHLRTQISVHGSSYATPYCNGILALMRNIYAKMFPGTASYGKYSAFMDHVRNRWCDHRAEGMDFAVGYGMPDILAEPYAPGLLSKAPEAECRDTVLLGDPLDIDYSAQKHAKPGFTPERQLSTVAITRAGKIFPLYPGALSLSLYSNSSRKAPEDYAANYYVSQIEVNVLPNVTGEVEGSLPLSVAAVSNENMDEQVVRTADTTLESKAFTVMFALDFTDKLYPADAGEYTTSRELLYFTNGEHAGRLVLDKISYATGDDYVDLTGCRFDHGYFEDTTEQTADYTIGWQIGKSMDMTAAPYGIVAMVCSDRGVDYFFNGTHIGHVPNVPAIDIKVSDVLVNKEPLCHDATGCVQIYDRVLTDEEIVRNTIFLLNSHFEEG